MQRSMSLTYAPSQMHIDAQRLHSERQRKALKVSLTPNTVELIPTLGALFSRYPSRGDGVKFDPNEVLGRSYRGTSLIRNCFLLGPYRRTMPRALRWS